MRSPELKEWFERHWGLNEETLLQTFLDQLKQAFPEEDWDFSWDGGIEGYHFVSSADKVFTLSFRFDSNFFSMMSLGAEHYLLDYSTYLPVVDKTKVYLKGLREALKSSSLSPLGGPLLDLIRRKLFELKREYSERHEHLEKEIIYLSEIGKISPEYLERLQFLLLWNRFWEEYMAGWESKGVSFQKHDVSLDKFYGDHFFRTYHYFIPIPEGIQVVPSDPDPSDFYFGGLELSIGT